MPAGLVRPNRPPQASKRDQNPSSYTSGLQSAGIWLAAPAASTAAARPPCEHAAGQPYHDPCNVAEPGRAVAEVRIVLPRAGLVHEREHGRQCSRCPGLRWYPARVISSHPRSITPAEPTRLGTARHDWPTPVLAKADVTTARRPDPGAASWRWSRRPGDGGTTWSPDRRRRLAWWCRAEDSHGG